MGPVLPSPSIGRQSTSRTRFRRLSLAAVKILAIDPVFERALPAEIAASELLRVRVLAATLLVLLVAEQLLFLFARDLVEQFTQKPLPAWLPAEIIGPFSPTRSWRCSFLLPTCAWKYLPNRRKVCQRVH